MGICNSIVSSEQLFVPSETMVMPCTLDRFKSAAQTYWSAMHQMTLTLHDVPTSEQIDDVWKWLVYFGLVIPCAHCGGHWQHMFRRLGRHRSMLMRTRNHAVSFMFEMHNLWNLNRHRAVFEWADFVDMYKITDSDRVKYIPTLRTVTRIDLLVINEHTCCK